MPTGKKLRLLCALALAAAAWLPAFSAAQTVLRASPFGPPGHLLNKKILQGWAESVSLATDGRVKIEVLPGPVAAPPAILDAIKSGLADVSLLSNGALTTKLPLNSMVEFAGQTPNSETASLAYQGVVQRHPAFASEYGDVRLLGVFTHGPGVLLMSRSGAAGKNDFGALTINAGGAGGRAVAQDLGAKPVMSAHPPKPEVFAEGQADGTVTTIDSYSSFNIAELIKEVITMPNGFYTAGFALVANAARWNALEPRDQAAILKVSGVALARLAGKAWDAGDAEALQKVRGAGVPVSTLSPAQASRMAEAGERRKKAWLDSLGANAGDGAAAVSEYRAEVAKQ